MAGRICWHHTPTAPRRWLAGLLLAALFAASVMSLQAGPPNGPGRHEKLERISPPRPAPVLNLDALDGERYRLSDYRGQVVLINFWSSWCSPCRREMPALERAWQRLRTDGVRVLGVAIQDDPKVVERFLRESGVTFPVLLDPDGTAAQQWPFAGIPATFVLDRRGRVVYRALGLRNWDGEELIGRLGALARTPLAGCRPRQPVPGEYQVSDCRKFPSR